MIVSGIKIPAPKKGAGMYKCGCRKTADDG